MPTASIRHGDALDVLADIPDNSIDAVVTDPPYGLTELPPRKVAAALSAWVGGDLAFVPKGAGFMGAAWDRFVPPPALWSEALRVLKPGGYLLSFAGARTLDIMSMSIRLAGFEVKDILAWLRGNSSAKSPYTLRAGHEPVLMAQKPLDGSVEANVARWGVGALDIDACRIPFASEADEAETKTKNAHGKFGTRAGGNNVYGDYGDGLRRDYDAPGRWPSNVLLDEHAAEELNERFEAGKPELGGPARFFPRFHYAGRASTAERPVVDGVRHSTVKPLSVMRWLVRLVAPEDGVVLDPFGGSGTTAEAALLEGRDCIIVEDKAEFIPLIEHRVARVS